MTACSLFLALVFLLSFSLSPILSEVKSGRVLVTQRLVERLIEESRAENARGDESRRRERKRVAVLAKSNPGIRRSESVRQWEKRRRGAGEKFSDAWNEVLSSKKAKNSDSRKASKRSLLMYWPLWWHLPLNRVRELLVYWSPAEWIVSPGVLKGRQRETSVSRVHSIWWCMFV